jgi:hypothetical protein
MTPVIGDLGFEALVKRSVFMTRLRFDFLDLEPSSPPNVARFLVAGPHDHRPAEILAAAAALLAQVFSLLFSFIGEDLTRRALARGWPELDLSTTDAEESKDE